MASLFGNPKKASLLYLLTKGGGPKFGLPIKTLARPLKTLRKEVAAEINRFEDIKEVVTVRCLLSHAWIDVNLVLCTLRKRRMLFKLLLLHLIHPLKPSKRERAGYKIRHLIKFAGGTAEERIKTAKRIVVSNENDFNIAMLAKTDFGFTGKLFFSKKLKVFDASLMIAKAMSLYHFTVEQLRVSTQLGLTITPAGEVIKRKI